MGETAVAEDTKKRAGRPPKPEAEKKRKATDDAGTEPKRKRGRPKGSGKKAAKKVTPKKGGTGRRGRPKKNAAEEPAEEAAEE